MANHVVENAHPSELAHEPHTIFRLLVSVQNVGGIIGYNLEYLKRICEETKASINLFYGPVGTTEVIVLISGKEDPDLPIPPAIDGLLKMHKRIIDTEVEANADNHQPGNRRKVVTRLLVPAPQAGTLVGKKGDTVKLIQASSRCTLCFRGGEDLPVLAYPKDSVVEIHGEPTLQYKAVELIATHLRKFVFNREILMIIIMRLQIMKSLTTENIPPRKTWGPPANVGSGGHSTILQCHPSSAIKIRQAVSILSSLYDASIGSYGLGFFSNNSGASIRMYGGATPDVKMIEMIGTPLQVEMAQKLIKTVVADHLVRKPHNSAGQV